MKHLITYGDSNYQKSKERLIDEANKTQLFDYLKAYQPSDLPQTITDNPIFQHTKGGGYWIWKPYIVRDALSKMKEGDILVYTDAGCSIYPSPKWNKYFAEMKDYSILAFRINCLNEQYTKREVIDLFNPTNGKMWKHFYQIAATTFIIKKSPLSILFVNEWETLCTQNLVLDVPPNELGQESKKFTAHRHDQALFTGLIYKYQKNMPIKIMWNDFEGDWKPGQAISGTRINDKGRRMSIHKMPLLKLILKHNIVIPIRSLRQLFWRYINCYYK